ncbi:MAG: DegT/DnrJ/EryC1/StrS family aminotransferase [Deltaproteobacteria bacterium]|nr:DegT/DnrJ/EryC1/StrS family aminotransferase [Deltaproteobacteria bacterium]MBW2307444.1 DegT/DnrJ/EryC1/StrS family aminotransferase [Deltaproteobacteria bacterium]
MNVPLLDLKEQFRTIEVDVRRAVDRVLATQQFILGPEVDAFEKEAASYTGVAHAVGVASGSDALILLFMAMGIGPGDGIVTTPYTFFSTAGSAAHLGIRPVFVDIDPGTYTISPEAIEKVLVEGGPPGVKLRAIVPVHIFGQCARMAPILKMAKEHDLAVIEDAAQAIGSHYQMPDGTIRMAGSMGRGAILSFFPSKNLGAMGDAGMVVTDDAALADIVRIMRNHGSRPKYFHATVGLNSRLDALQAAVLRVKLSYLDRWHEARRANAQRYRELFQSAGLVESGHIVLPARPPDDGKNGYRPHIYNQYVVRARDRNALREHLKKRGIGTEIYYPLPLHLQECFRNYGYREGDLPASEQASRETLALPIYPELTPEQQQAVVESIEEFYRQS